MFRYYRGLASWIVSETWRFCTENVRIDTYLAITALAAALIVGSLTDIGQGVLVALLTFLIFVLCLVAINCLRAPYVFQSQTENFWENEKRRADELDEARKPRLLITAKEVSHPVEKRVALVLGLKNLGTDTIQNCYARLAHLVWDMGEGETGSGRIVYHDLLQWARRLTWSFRYSLISTGPASSL